MRNKSKTKKLQTLRYEYDHYASKYKDLIQSANMAAFRMFVLDRKLAELDEK